MKLVVSVSCTRLHVAVTKHYKSNPNESAIVDVDDNIPSSSIPKVAASSQDTPTGAHIKVNPQPTVTYYGRKKKGPKKALVLDEGKLKNWSYQNKFFFSFQREIFISK